RAFSYSESSGRRDRNPGRSLGYPARMRRRGIVAGSIVAAITGCAAIAGLDDPSPISDVGDGAALDVASGDVTPGTDGGADAADANVGYGSGAEGALVI